MKFTVHTVRTKLARDEELKRLLLHFQHKTTGFPYFCTAFNRVYRFAKKAPLLRNYVIQHAEIIYLWAKFHQVLWN